MAACLPPDLIPGILSLLPVTSLLRFKCVSKEWFNLITDPFFVKLHVQKFHLIKRSLAFILCCDEKCILDDLDSPDDSNMTKLSWLPKKCWTPNIVDSCNGLLCCMTAFPDHDLWVCNPSMRTFKKVQTKEHPFLQISMTRWGFGYDSKDDEYKIVAADGFQKNMFVYGLKEAQWRHLPQCAVKDGCGFKHHGCDQTARFMNNRLHWIVFSRNRETGNCSLGIARFNLSSEEWNELLSMPAARNAVEHNLNILEGCLCLTMTRLYPMSVETWMMNEYGAQGSWSRLFSASYDFPSLTIRPISYSKDGTKILLSSGLLLGLFWYDPKKETITGSDVIDKQVRAIKSDFHFVVYAQTLVSIPNGTTSTPIAHA